MGKDFALADYKGYLWNKLLGMGIQGGGMNSSGGGTASALGMALGTAGLVAGATGAGALLDKSKEQQTTTGTGGALKDLTPVIPKDETTVIPKDETTTLQPNPTQPKEEEPKQEIIPEIVDGSNNNIESTINGNDMSQWLKYAEEMQQKQWEREDQIRKETQEREDTAYSRAVADMWRAGINPNLMGSINPAESGGGITTATGMNYSAYESEIQKEVALLEQQLDQIFKGDQAEKDKIADLISNIISSIVMYKTFKK